MDNYTYELGENLYINLTSKCSNDCTFCVRNEHTTYFGHKLWLEHEPTAQEVLERIPADIKKYREYVFCGFGEPTIRLDTLLEVGKALRARGALVRLNTNGQANMLAKRDVTKELCEAVDEINVSLNEGTAEDYVKLCRPAYGAAAFEGLQDFAKKCAAHGVKVWFSVVDVIGPEKIALCREIAENCGVTLRVRPYIADSE